MQPSTRDKNRDDNEWLNEDRCLPDKQWGMVRYMLENTGDQVEENCKINLWKAPLYSCEWGKQNGKNSK